MNYDYLVFPNFTTENFEITCNLIEGMIPGLKINNSLNLVDGLIKDYKLGNKGLTVYGRIRDDDVCVSSEFELTFLKRRPVTYD